jgi:hypothetical protein
MMRTTITLEDQLAKSLQERAHNERTSFKRIVNRALQLGLNAMETPANHNNQPYRLKPASMGEPQLGINLAKARQLADFLEDEAITLKLEARK